MKCKTSQDTRANRAAQEYARIAMLIAIHPSLNVPGPRNPQGVVEEFARTGRTRSLTISECALVVASKSAVLPSSLRMSTAEPFSSSHFA